MESKKPEPNFYVIGAGLSRNGTMSMRAALETLYGGKCYHGDEVYAYTKNHDDFWYDLHRGTLSDEDIKDWFTSQGYVAGVDCPFSLYYRRFMRIFPNAKVILNVRDSRKWYHSVKNALVPLWQTVTSFPLKIILPPEEKLEHISFTAPNGEIDKQSGVIGSTLRGEKAAVEFYEEWQRMVKENVPEDRLLIFNVAEGWEPLCKFLEVPVPDKPFPRVNDTNELLRRLKIAKTIAWSLVAFAPVVVGFGIKTLCGYSALG
eukprot:CAMPEP_0114972306 /NCGR_PEP_ID=MMETSP0216-20121206/321_1 /TAXON_ID=223996 /ORGANISM="Protocruzia adherens, Strain Boccale" /LENGTH=259 /DNA_ID=CAMNT_0002332663 /DNA_START=294 /DNA_END=1073 /DNA_ORIENTATION=-